jgi:hypothetical protein
LRRCLLSRPWRLRRSRGTLGYSRAL